MEIHRHLSITGPRATLDTILARIDAAAETGVNGWRRAKDREKSIEHFGIGGGDPMHSYECTRKSARAHASVWFTFRGEGQELHVSTIVPCEDEPNQLKLSESNAVITSFHDDLVAPAVATGTGVLVELTSDTAAPEDWLNKKTATLLRLFASQANKNTGSGHPSDQKRWLSFLIAAHRDQEELSASRVAEWLTEEGGFSIEVANDLAIEYEQGRALLEEYDQERM